MMWLAKSPDEKSVVGHRALAIHPDALMHAVGELVSVGPEVGDAQGQLPLLHTADDPFIRPRYGQHMRALGWNLFLTIHITAEAVLLQ